MYSSMNIYIQPVNVKWFSIVFFLSISSMREDRKRKTIDEKFFRKTYPFFLSLVAVFCVLSPYSIFHFAWRWRWWLVNCGSCHTQHLCSWLMWRWCWCAAEGTSDEQQQTDGRNVRVFQAFFLLQVMVMKDESRLSCMWSGILAANFHPAVNQFRSNSSEMTRVRNIYFLIDSSWMLLLLLAVRHMNEIEMYLRHSRRRKLWLTWNTMFNTHRAIDEPMSKSSRRHGHKNTKKM